MTLSSSGTRDVGHVLKQAGKNRVNLPSAIANGGRNFVVNTANIVVDGYRDIYNLAVYSQTPFLSPVRSTIED